MAVTGTVVEMEGINGKISPVPFAGRPIKVWLFTQLKLAVGAELANEIPFKRVPLQIVISCVGIITGAGFTVIVKVSELPAQICVPFTYCAVTVMVAVIGVLPVLVAVKTPILPVPLAAKPIDGLLLLQTYVVPVDGPVKLMAAAGEPLHTTWFCGATT